MIYCDVEVQFSHISLRVWSDVIHVGMAHRSQTLKCVKLKNVMLSFYIPSWRLILMVIGLLMKCFVHEISLTLSGSCPPPY